jgi:signal transduction histidine kinase
MHSDAPLQSLAGTILAIDDQPAHVRTLMDCLEREGYEVAVALSGEEGLQRASLVQPDLILLDVQMPGIDGFETCRRLKADVETKSIPVVFMTALTDTADKLAGFEAGGVDYVTKPVDRAEVVARIHTHVALYRLQRELAQKNRDLEQLAFERAKRQQVEGESAELRRLLQEREEMLGLLAHEVRQPLNNASAALQNACAVVSGSTEADERVRTPLVRAQHVLDHVIGTLNNALTAATMFAMPGEQAAVDTDLETLVQLVVHDVSPQDRARVRVRSTTAARTVRLQPVLMRLALCNLLLNALAYSPPESEVELRIVDSDEPLAIVFEVADEGQGIQADLMPVLFEKGTRGRGGRERSGAGLGLYIVGKVVQMHHGNVDVEANVPRGSIFRISIPQGVGG